MQKATHTAVIAPKRTSAFVVSVATKTVAGNLQKAKQNIQVIITSFVNLSKGVVCLPSYVQ